MNAHLQNGYHVPSPTQDNRCKHFQDGVINSVFYIKKQKNNKAPPEVPNFNKSSCLLKNETDKEPLIIRKGSDKTAFKWTIDDVVFIYL